MSPAMELLRNNVISDTAQIDAAIAELAETWNRHDGLAYAAVFADDADFVNVLGMRSHGRAEIAERHVHLLQTIMRKSVLHILHHSVRFLTETIALAHVKWEEEGHEAPPAWNFRKVRQGVLSLVFQKQSEGWKIAGAHNTDLIEMS